MAVHQMYALYEPEGDVIACEACSRCRIKRALMRTCRTNASR